MCTSFCAFKVGPTNQKIKPKKSTTHMGNRVILPSGLREIVGWPCFWKNYYFTKAAKTWVLVVKRKYYTWLKQSFGRQATQLLADGGSTGFWPLIITRSWVTIFHQQQIVDLCKKLSKSQTKKVKKSGNKTSNWQHPFMSCSLKGAVCDILLTELQGKQILQCTELAATCPLCVLCPAPCLQARLAGQSCLHMQIFYYYLPLEP